VRSPLSCAASLHAPQRTGIVVIVTRRRFSASGRLADTRVGCANAHGGRLREAESPCATDKGRGGAASLFADGFGMRPSPPRATPTLRLGPGPYVRRLSYELRIAYQRSLSRRTRHPPPHLLSSGRFTAPALRRELSRGRQRTPGLPISPGDPACSHPHTARGTSSCLSKRGEMECSMRRAAHAGISFESGDCSEGKARG
jgi:hypothetical protein